MSILRQAAAAVLTSLLLLLASALAAGAAPASAPNAPVACSELVQNGGFEAQSANWTQEGAPGLQLITGDNPRTGNYSAYLGGVTSSDHAIKQQIALPAGQIITLRFWVYQDTLEHAASADDYLAVRLLNTSGAQPIEIARYDVDPDLPLDYQPYSVNLSTYAGKTVQLQFLVHNGPYNQTWYYIDDVSVSACAAKRVYLPLIRR